MYFKFRFGYDLRVRKFLLLIIILITFFSISKISFAQEQKTPSSTPAASDPNGYGAIITSPSNPDDIVEGHKIITVKFTIPSSEIGNEFLLCQEADCGETHDKLNNGIADSKPTTASFDIKVCGAEAGVLQTNNCENSGSDLYGGMMYYLTLVKHERESTGQVTTSESFTPVASVSFYVKRIYPNVDLTSENENKPRIGSKPILHFSQNEFPVPEDALTDTYTYKVQVFKIGASDEEYDYQEEVELNENNKSDDLKITTNGETGGGLPEGNYIVKIFRKSSPFTDSANTVVGGDGFLMYTIDFSVTNNGGKIGVKKKDPEGKDNRLFAAGDQLSPTPPPLPCLEGWKDDQKTIISQDPKEIKYCTKVGTALGSLEVMPLGLISNLLRWFLGIAGSASLIIFLYAGYVLMTSAGNKEKVQGARETITSAIVGLIFIIFSVAILEFIGVDILQIPGLGK